jgi:biopolymer transport protein ExbB
MTSLRLAICALLLTASAAGAAESFQSAKADVDKRLSRSLQELTRVRDKIAKEKIPLSRSVSNLEDEVLALRQEHSRLLQVRDSRTIDLTSLRKQVDSLSTQEDFVDSRLSEFSRDFEGRLDISELPLYEDRTSAARLAEGNDSLTRDERRKAQLDVVGAALERVDALLGGQVFAGQALDPEGVLTEGSFISFGPTVFYTSHDGTVAGLVENRLNTADPVTVPIPHAEEILQVANGGQGSLPLDATLGKAVKVEKARKSLFQHLEDGGAVGSVIAGLGLAAILLTIFKGREILSFQVAAPQDLDGVLDELAKGNREAAAYQAEQVEGVAGEMLRTGVHHASESRGILEELLFEKILAVRPHLERYLPFLAITAAAAPLLGLLGTVTGMIKTFQLITIFGTGDAKSLSSGISEALVTTAMGLIVAIPALVLHGALSRMAKRKLGLLEQLSVAFVNGVSALHLTPAAGRARPSGDRDG